VAVGASETAGVGADHPSREAWPSVLHDRALPRATYVNVGVSGSTVGQALATQLPQALAAEPDVATVWLAVNDITHLVPVEAYEQQLRTLVHELRRGGRTTVLVGNVPAVQDLPAYRACLPDAEPSAVTCRLPVVPPEEQVAATVTEFNAAVDRVAAAEGAHVVDLSQRRDLTRLTADDGFHPSTEGHRRIATAFARALER
jgi:lysophospholipase L1-like esterase